MKNYFIQKISILLMCFISISYSQQVTIWGHVSTPLNGMLVPVEGAIIQNNYMNSAGVTNEDGFYQWSIYLLANSNEVTLQCMFDGFQTQNFVLELNPNQVEYEVNFTLNHTNQINTILSGYVIENSGCLGGPIGCPIVEASIEAVPLISISDEIYSGISGENGFFEIELPVGVYSVTCYAEGWEAQTQMVEVSINGVTIGFNLLPVNNQEIFLEGNVYNANSTAFESFPIDGAFVLLHSNNGEIIGETHSSDNGYYSFNELAQNASHLTVSAQGFEDYEAEINFEDCSAITNCFPLQINIYLNPLDDYMLNGSLRGYVSAQFSPMGPEMILNGATILATSISSNGTVQTFETHSNEDGAYFIELPFGPYIVSCHANIDDYPFPPQTMDLYIHSGEELEQNFHFTPWTMEVQPPVDLTVTVVDNPLGGTAQLNWEYPYFMIPELQVNYNIYFNNDLNPNNQWDFIGETNQLSFEMILGDFVQTTGCFRITAEISGEESIPSNVACIGDVNPINGMIYGSVTYIYGDIAELVSGALITVQGLNLGTVNPIEYETHTNEDGMYEISVVPGAYLVTATIDDGQFETQDVFVESGHEENINFTFYSEVMPEIHIEGNVYCADVSNQDCNIENGIILVYESEFQLASYEFHNGHFSFTLQNPGLYYFTFIADGFQSTEIELEIEHSMVFDVEMIPISADSYLIAGNVTASPMDTIRVPLYLNSSTSFAGLQFYANTNQLLYPVGFESAQECFNANFGEVYGQLFGLMFSLEGCILEPGEHYLADMLFTISPWTESFGEIEVHLGDIILSDADANSVPILGVSGSVQLGMKGDVNGDNEINVLDIVVVVNIILMSHEPNDYEFWASDLNSDGDINVLDVVSIINSILLIPMEINDISNQVAQIEINENILRINAAQISGIQILSNNKIITNNLNDNWEIREHNGNYVIYSMNLVSSSNFEFIFENNLNNNFEILLSDSNGNEILHEINEIPIEIQLGQNYPNPFNPLTNINVKLNHDTDLQLNIYDMNGKLIEQITNRFYVAGNYDFLWDTSKLSNLSSGLYIYKLITPEQVISSKMILMK